MKISGDPDGGLRRGGVEVGLVSGSEEKSADIDVSKIFFLLTENKEYYKRVPSSKGRRTNQTTAVTDVV